MVAVADLGGAAVADAIRGSGSLLGNVLADTGNLRQLCGADEAASCNWAGDSESVNTSSLRSGIV